jgi:small conductance mechanosensitive channel
MPTIDTSNLDHLQKQLIDLSVQYGPKLLAAILIMVAGFFVSRWIGKLVGKWTSKLELEPPVRLLMLRVVRLMVMLLFLVMMLQQLGFQLLPLIAGLSVAGAGIALAMQGVLSNLFAGLTIILSKPFRVGEYVQITSVEGQVQAIDLFSTKLLHADKSRVVIPNRKIVGEILHNYGKIRQLSVSVGVAYGTDLNAALAVVSEVVNSNPMVLKEPAPVVGVTALADSSVNIFVGPWVNVPDFGGATAAINKGIAEAFRQRGISIPFPQREVRLLNPAA